MFTETILPSPWLFVIDLMSVLVWVALPKMAQRPTKEESDHEDPQQEWV